MIYVVVPRRILSCNNRPRMIFILLSNSKNSFSKFEFQSFKKVYKMVKIQSDYVMKRSISERNQTLSKKSQKIYKTVHMSFHFSLYMHCFHANTTRKTFQTCNLVSKVSMRPSTFFIKCIFYKSMRGKVSF